MFLPIRFMLGMSRILRYTETDYPENEWHFELSQEEQECCLMRRWSMSRHSPSMEH